jgi:excisionase family DNA binding protein
MTFDDIARLEKARRKHRSRRERIEDGLEQEWYTVPEAAEVLRMSTKWVYERIRKGELDYSKPSPRKTHIHYTDLAKYMSKKGGKNVK